MLRASGTFLLYRDLHPADRIGKLFELIRRKLHYGILPSYAREHGLTDMLPDRKIEVELCGVLEAERIDRSGIR